MRRPIGLGLTSQPCSPVGLGKAPLETEVFPFGSLGPVHIVMIILIYSGGSCWLLALRAGSSNFGIHPRLQRGW